LGRLTQFKKEHNIKEEKSSDNISPESEFGVILKNSYQNLSPK